MNLLKLLFFLACIPLIFNTCNKKFIPNDPNFSDTASLKKTYVEHFYVGAAINDNQINRTDVPAVNLIKREFNTISPENIMKWMYIHPSPDSFYFDMADKYVALGEENNQYIIGHTLLWHSQIADWMHEVKDSAEMANHLENHIKTIVGHFKGRVHAWDVINEAFNDDGSLRESLFLDVMGEEYIELAFKWAAEADPEAELIYNDYNLWNPKKRVGVVRMVQTLNVLGVKIDGIGMQAHYSLIGPSIEDIEKSIIAYSNNGVKVSFTEFDITTLPNPWDLKGAEVSQNFEGSPFMNPYPEGLPDSVQVKLADRYEAVFKLLVKYQDRINRVTFWGVNDGQSWLNDWPIKNRTNYPLLFDRAFQPKEAYHRVMKLTESQSE